MDIVIAEMLFAAAAEIIMDNFRNVSFKTPSVKVSEKCKFLSAREEEKKLSNDRIMKLLSLLIFMFHWQFSPSRRAGCVCAWAFVNKWFARRSFPIYIFSAREAIRRGSRRESPSSALKTRPLKWSTLVGLYLLNDAFMFQYSSHTQHGLESVLFGYDWR